METRLAQANGRLKSAKVGVNIEAIGNRLYLRATFPPKPDSVKQSAYQQRLSLGYHCNPSGLKLAESEARKIGALLDCNEFDWMPYIRQQQAVPQTCSEWIDRFEKDYFTRRERNQKSETTWLGDYIKVFKKLPQDSPLTHDLLDHLIKSTKPDSKTRKRACVAVAALAKFAKLDYDPSSMSGNYSPRRVQPRDLPDDRTIAEWFYKLPSPTWRWAYGMMATYGLRPHEVFRLDLEMLRGGSIILSILSNTKTGDRRVWACYPEWFEQFNLTEVHLPKVNLERSNEKLGGLASANFQRLGVPFPPYSLRHAWAIRTLEYGLPDTLAAQQMGHSVQVHNDLYHHWITDTHHQRAFDLLMNRSDRPFPPEIV